jgi:hypothetical protein
MPIDISRLVFDVHQALCFATVCLIALHRCAAIGLRLTPAALHFILTVRCNWAPRAGAMFLDSSCGLDFFALDLGFVNRLILTAWIVIPAFVRRHFTAA